MPRLIGAERTLDLIISAKPVDAATAVQYGFVDRIIEGDLASGALAYLAELVAAGAGPRRTGSLSVDPASATDAVFAAAEAAMAAQPSA